MKEEYTFISDGKTINIKRSDIDSYHASSLGCAIYLKGSNEAIYVNEDFDTVDSIFDL